MQIVSLIEEVQLLDSLDREADAKKADYTAAYNAAEIQRGKVLTMLQEAGQTKFHVDGVGTVSQAIRTSVSVPKTPEERAQMLDWFEKQGDDFYYSYVTVNSQSLNSLVRQKMEEDPGFRIPGVGELKQNAELRFRRG